MKAIIIITGSEFVQGRKQDKNGLFIAKIFLKEVSTFKV
jgi:hypothetical protein